MPLDPDIEAVLRVVNAQPPMHHGSIPEMRKARERKGLFATASIDRVEDGALPGPAGLLRMRFYAPEKRDQLSLVLFFHGGGFVFGSLDGYYDHVCRMVSLEADCAVLSVDYRLAPENKFPAASDDCLAALAWAHANAGSLGIDPAAIFVAGGSAGGNLAAVTALRARDEGAPAIRGQILLYPVTDYHTPASQSYRDFADGHYLTRADMLWFWEQYLASEIDAENPYASPMKAGSLAGLPPALVVTAEYDPLRDEAEAYAARLQLEGVPARLSRYEGMIHGFLAFPTGAAPRLYAEVGGWIQDVLANSV